VVRGKGFEPSNPYGTGHSQKGSAFLSDSGGNRHHILRL